MSRPGDKRIFLRARWAVPVIVASLIMGWSVVTVHGQGLFGLPDPRSPLAFVPGLCGELRVGFIGMGVEQGKLRIPSQNVAYSLRNDFAMHRNYLFVDAMIRLQVDRFALRAYYEQREFVGMTAHLRNPALGEAHSRLEFSGIRLGADLDIIRYWGLRAGLNMDYYLYEPVFSQSIFTSGGGMKIRGETPLTWGAHAFWNPAPFWYGITPIIEARAQWPVSGAKITDWEIVAGLKLPETVLGATALRVGYRNTTIEFSKGHRFHNVIPVSSDFDAQIGGWFGELAYYY